MAIEWSINELQEAIDQIMHSQKIIYLEEADSYILFKYPSKYDLKLSEIEQEKIIRKGKREGLQSSEEIEKKLLERGLWTPEHQERADALDKKIFGLKTLKDDESLTKTETRRKVIQESIDKLEKELKDLTDVREKAMENTAEVQAKYSRVNFLSWKCTFDPYTKKRLWNSFNDYFMEKDAFKNEVLINLLRWLEGFTTEEIRYIARSSLWRVYYVLVNKANTRLFNKTISDFTQDQLNLVYWSSYYENIYSMSPDDRPSDEIINDDEELDKWIGDFSSRREHENRTGRRLPNKSSAMDREEVLVFKSNPLYEKIEYTELPVSGGTQTDLNTVRESNEKRGFRIEKTSRKKRLEKQKRMQENS